MIFLAIIIGLFLFTQIAIRIGLSKIERQKYFVVKVFSGFQIRKYPEALVAATYCAGHEYKTVARSGFSRIARFIFGRNTSGKKIAMTAPVRIEFGTEQSSIEFVMPGAYSLKNLPQPVDQSVQIKSWEGGYFAALRFGGFPDDKRILKAIETLRKHLQEADISFTDKPIYLGYNPPYQIVFRKNEVILPVTLNVN